MAIKIYLSDLLKEKKIKSKDLAKAVGITEANLSILRSGKAKAVRFTTLNAICEFLDCDVEDILKYEKEG